MEKIISAMEDLRDINNTYDISTDTINSLCLEMMQAKVCTPIIGKFSSGKSALVNTLLGYKKRILKEDITPETAIPVEIEYSDKVEQVVVTKNDGGHKDLTIDEFRKYEADASTVKKACMKLRNSTLEGFPDVMIVDMPGFESGFEIHNKAIDEYLPSSLAYIITFPADDMILRSSVGNILKELCLYDMPICIVITKYDKKNSDFEKTFNKLKDDLKRYIGNREVNYCFTSSFTGDAEELEDFLKEIQRKSQCIIGEKYKKQALAAVENTDTYLKTLLNNYDFSESELEEQEEKLSRQMSDLDSRFAEEQDNFDEEVEECLEEIKGDVQQALADEEDTFVAMAMNGQDIKDHLNTVVRSAVTVSIKKRFIPKVEKYLKRVSKTLSDGTLGDVNISFTVDTDKLGKGLTAAIVAIAAGILLGLPVLGVIAGIILKIVGDKKREEAKQDIRRRLQTEVYPQVITEVGNGIEQAIAKQITMINTSIENELKNQKDILDKAMSDLRTKIKDEKTKKDTLINDIKSDLERIGEIKDGLQ